MESSDITKGSSSIHTLAVPISTHPITVPGAWRKVSVTVKHFWYHQWKDFGIPPPEDETAIRMLARTAADIVKSATSSVAVNCLSGRGRTGTFSAIILGEMLKVKSHAELVDVIVGMRENRDGMVETPEQLRFAARVLGLPDTADCGVLCDAEKTFDTAMESIPYGAFFMGILVAVFLQVCIWVCRLPSQCGHNGRHAPSSSSRSSHKHSRNHKGKYHPTLSTLSSDSDSEHSRYSSDADSCACPLTLYGDSSTSGESSSINSGGSNSRLQSRTGSRETTPRSSGNKHTSHTPANIPLTRNHTS